MVDNIIRCAEAIAGRPWSLRYPEERRRENSVNQTIPSQPDSVHLRPVDEIEFEQQKVFWQAVRDAGATFAIAHGLPGGHQGRGGGSAALAARVDSPLAGQVSGFSRFSTSKSRRPALEWPTMVLWTEAGVFTCA